MYTPSEMHIKFVGCYGDKQQNDLSISMCISDCLVLENLQNILVS